MVILRRIWAVLPIVTVVIGVLSWVPNLVLGAPRGYWVLTWVVNPVGMLIAFLGLRRGAPYARFGVIANGVMSVSFFLVMFFGYLIAFLTGGKP
jgi:hypothetical protein